MNLSGAMIGYGWFASLNWSWRLDGWIIVAGMLCAISSAMLGTFLVLRRMSLLGDAISHAVLPGLAGAFLLSGSRSSIWMFVGAVLVGVLTALLSDFIHRRGQVDEGASMGVVFTTLFAAGLVMIVMAADRVDLDPGCVLYGAIEQIPLDTWSVSLPGGTVWRVPRVVWILSLVTLINTLFVITFFKELKLSTFDGELANATGFSASLIHYLLMTLVAITAVASFESVGNILVVAMFVVPPATAYLLTNRLGMMIGLGCLIGAICAGVGHIAAMKVPAYFGFRSTTTAGMMAVATGAAFLLALFFSPQQGLLPRLARRWWLSWSILADDVLALLYRVEERAIAGIPLNDDPAGSDPTTWMADSLLAGRSSVSAAIRFHRWRGKLEDLPSGSFPKLTIGGRAEAQALVRSHRLWEQYLVTQGDVEGQQIHTTAHRLEHFTDSSLREKLDDQTDSPQTDPHGSPIPPNEDASPNR